MTRSTCGRLQAGVGLVEIMIALVIGLVLVAGLTQIYVSSKQGFRVQEAQSRLQESARLMSVLLSSGIAKAEFQRNAQDDPTTIFGAVNPVIGGTDNEAGGTAILDGTDTLSLSFQGDGVMTHCLGGVVAVDAVSTNTYRVTDDRALQCIAATTTAAGTATATQPLVDDVDNMQIRYGEDTNSDGSVDRYVNAAAVADFDDVLSVHVAVLLASAADVKPAATSATYNLLGTNVTMPPTGHRIQRRVVERVIALRNRLR